MSKLLKNNYKNVISVYFDGGLGNQMFQYAFLLNLKQHYPSSLVNAYLKTVYGDSTHYGYELNKVFNIKLDEQENLENFNLIKEHSEVFMPQLFSLDTFHNWIIKGFWGNKKYFMPVESELRRDFTFSAKLYEEYETLINKMKNESSVSVHIRRGDFLTGHIQKEPLSYYEDAIEYMNKRLENPVFYFFSDDMAYTKQKFAHLPHKVFVENNREEESYKDMFLISQCQNHILNGNSTFSFWGAWLNPSKEKIVLTSNVSVFNNWIVWGTKDFPEKSSTKVSIDTEKIHICYTLRDFNGKYSKFIGTSICSILENTKSNIVIHIIHDDTLTEENKSKFMSLVNTYKQNIHFYSIVLPDELHGVSREKFDEMIFQNLSQENKININAEKFIVMKNPEIINEDILSIWHNYNTNAMSEGGGYKSMLALSKCCC